MWKSEVQTIMDVKAINNVSFVNFEGKPKKQANKKQEHNYPQQTDPASKKSAQALRNMMYGLMLLGATVGGASSLTSCEKQAYAEANAEAYAWVIGGGCDNKNDTVVIHDTIINTIIKPVYIKEYPFHLADSLIKQGLNIGVELDGPVPEDENNDVAFVASRAHNRYDDKYYETQVDSIGTNKNRLSLVTKVLDFYEDPENPKISWMRTEVADVPGKGIKLTRYSSNSTTKPEEWDWQYTGYEIRTNNRNGQTNTKSVFDKNNELIWEGEYKRGENPGTFMYGTFVYDEDGNPYLDEDGNPQKAYYDFDKGKMWSDRVILEKIPGNQSTTYFDY